jgi:hypothetical protein
MSVVMAASSSAGSVGLTSGVFEPVTEALPRILNDSGFFQYSHVKSSTNKSPEADAQNAGRLNGFSRALR